MALRAGLFVTTDNNLLVTCLNYTEFTLCHHAFDVRDF